MGKTFFAYQMTFWKRIEGAGTSSGKKIDGAETFSEKKIDGAETFPEKNDGAGTFFDQ